MDNYGVSDDMRVELDAVRQRLDAQRLRHQQITARMRSMVTELQQENERLEAFWQR